LLNIDNKISSLAIWQRYLVIYIQQSITLLRNNIFQRNFLIASAIYWELSVRSVTQVRSDLTFLSYDVQGGLLFSGRSAVIAVLAFHRRLDQSINRQTSSHFMPWGLIINLSVQNVRKMAI